MTGGAAVRPVRFLGVQNMDGEGFGRLERHLRGVGHELHVVRAWRGEAPPDPSAWDAVLVSGSPLAAYDWERHPFLTDEAAFLRRTAGLEVPCLGICFGAQFLAHLLGGRAYRAPRAEIGVYRVRLTEEGRRDPLLAGFPPAWPVLEWHGDTFDPPPGAALLATGEVARHQVWRRGRVVGVQFHPEVTPAEVGRWAAAHPEDLAAVGKTAAAVVDECRAIDAELDRVAVRLLDNFVAAVVRRPRGPIPPASHRA